ncbi:MAG TPA: translation initiation factor IF-3 [Candidatus Omnitrophota bacterium]|nr:translation initiation factor IF-3 [Candidatus Omnitrophota bacterium]
MNQQIRAREVRVIGPNSEQLGVVAIQKALELSNEFGLDLVEVAPTAAPPVCRIIDFSKYKYDQEKKERRVRKSQHVTHLKQIRLKPHIGNHDLQIKMDQAIAFLSKKDKVKINLVFHGREMSFRDQWRSVLDRVVAMTSAHATIEKTPLAEGRIVSMVLAPKAETK